MKRNKIITIGLMGNSGCGKSTVSNYLRKKGGFIIDADKISHSLMEPNKKCYNEVVAEFGNCILNTDGTINRKSLGAIVFNDRKKLDRLNEISHKIIVEEILRIKNEIIENPTEYKYIVIDAPLLSETGLNDKCDVVWIVYADYEKRIDRIMNRDNISREKTEERFKSQTDFEILKKFADEILDNSNEDTTELFDKVDRMLTELWII